VAGLSVRKNDEADIVTYDSIGSMKSLEQLYHKGSIRFAAIGIGKPGLSGSSGVSVR
jgi:hypothetical protein